MSKQATDSYAALLRMLREIHLLESTGELLSWDQETMMPAGAVDHRANQLACLARLAHERATAEELGQVLASLPASLEDPVQDANLREARRAFDRSTRLEAKLVSEIAETSSRAQHAWAAARQDSDFAQFRPWLEKMVKLMRLKADCLREDDMDCDWDALAEGFEPGMRARDLNKLFPPLRAELCQLLQEIRNTGKQAANPIAQVELPLRSQEQMVRMVAERMGFDFNRGRLDRSTHPFCGGTHCSDVRITTRFGKDNFLDALGSTMHEAGHGLYEQGILEEHLGTPMGTAVSLGIHESQSRLWENQVGRSAAFWDWCHPQLAQFFGGAFANFNSQDFYAASNRAEASLIRVEADECSYNLHVMIRFDLELALIAGDLAAADLPTAWNQAYRDYLGLDVPDDRNGCLQDVHWSCGLFGYFPTYTLGNLYSAQFFDKARADLGDLPHEFQVGDFRGLKSWLNEKIHAQGMRYPAAELCRQVTGRELDSSGLINYLRGKLGPLYGI
ncbi:MAG: carboxypeptidase M32 [Planctomycetota bacterium]|jgi:carboxypeptidase Taq